MFAVVWKCLHCFLNKTQYLLQTDVDLSMALWGKGHQDVFLLRVYFFILKMSRLLLHSCISCCLRFCFNKFIWFFISSISLSLLLDVCFVLEGTLAANFLRRYCVWDGCNNSSFLKRVGGSSLMFILLGFIKGWTFGSIIPVLPLITFA